MSIVGAYFYIMNDGYVGNLEGVVCKKRRILA